LLALRDLVSLPLVVLFYVLVYMYTNIISISCMLLHVKLI
jgi:hypothetical protein